jgi:glycosyltransferase involved in cell wall biosynthesis
VPVVSDQLPALSVVIPTHNRPRALRECVSRIFGQEYAGLIECVVVFDKSDITPIDVPTSDRRVLKLIANHRTPGLAGARNSGILASSGTLMAFCDDDDEWEPGKLTAQLALWREHPDARVVSCGNVLVYGDRLLRRTAPERPVTLDDLLVRRLPTLAPATFLTTRAAVVDEIGLIDEAIPGSHGEDYDWLLRVAAIAPIPVAPAPLVRINWQPPDTNFGRRWDTIAAANEYLLHKHPRLAGSSRGLARIEGQTAFAHAARGSRREAVRWTRRSLGHSPIERRAYLALAVTAGLPAGFVVKLANSRGRGI